MGSGLSPCSGPTFGRRSPDRRRVLEILVRFEEIRGAGQRRRDICTSPRESFSSVGLHRVGVEGVLEAPNSLVLGYEGRDIYYL